MITFGSTVPLFAGLLELINQLINFSHIIFYFSTQVKLQDGKF